jgi:hypothetical protein
MSTCIELYNVTDLPDLLDYAYHRYITVGFLFGSVIILSTVTNMCLFNSIKKYVKEIKQSQQLLPPDYK